MPKLTKRFVDTVKEPGFYGDGEGLYLSVKRSGSKSWILRTMVMGKRRDLGLGAAGIVSLSSVREQAREFRKVARAGGDPTVQTSEKDPTFAEVAQEYHAIISRNFSSEKHSELWLKGLEHHIYPHIGRKRLRDIGTTDVRRALEPIWVSKYETARKLRQRIEAVFDWSKAEGMYSAENPCIGLKRSLRPQKRMPVHHAAMSWQDVPDFYRRLREMDTMSAVALRLIILTACRSNEVRGARWSEIEHDTWIVPEERTKTRRPHRVPLSKEAKAVIESTRGIHKSLVFPNRIYDGNRGIGQLSVNAFRPLYSRMNAPNVTTHGFRSTFRDWCSEQAEAPREVAEAALAHMPGQVERAYKRTDLFERRRELMGMWSRFVCQSSCG